MEPRSIEGERALREAHAVMSAKPPSLEAVEAVDRTLHEAGLPDIDPVWVRWGYFVERVRNAAAAEGRS